MKLRLNKYLHHNKNTSYQQVKYISTINNNTLNHFFIKSKHEIKNPNYLYFLGGFVEGEGSNSVAVSVNKFFKYGVSLQPIFSVAQHKNGINILYSFKELFGTGSVVEKSGSNDVWVYTLKGYRQIIEHVIPFLETYVQPFSCKTNEFDIFKDLVFKSEAGQQKNQETLIEMVKLAYTLQGKGKYRKRSLDEVIGIIKDKKTYFNQF